MHVAERDVAADVGEFLDAVVVADRVGEVGHLEHPLEADQRGHQVHACVRQLGQRRVQLPDVQREGDDRARLELATDREAAADEVHQRRRDGPDQTEGREQHPAVHGGPDADVGHAFGTVVEQLLFIANATEELDQECPGDVEPLGHRRVHLGVQAHGLARQLLEATTDDARWDDEQRQQADRQQGHAPVEDRHRRDGHCDRDRVVHDPAERAGQRPLGADHVVVEPCDQRTRLRSGEERQRHAQDVFVQLLPQLEDEALADRGAEVALHE